MRETETSRCALVAGALGIVGTSIVETLQSGGWSTIGIARSPAASTGRHRHLQVDLGDPLDCRRAIGPLAGEITHVFFAARGKAPDPETERRVNLAFLTNLLDALDVAESKLEHVALVHGTKWYGSHLGPYRTPAREDDPRLDIPLFYYDQQDELDSRSRRGRFTWSAVRPHLLLGVASGYPHNFLSLLGAYGSLCRELGLPLDFPGTEAAFRSVSQATDVTLLAKAMCWSATVPHATNQAYNVINGDYFRWCNVWPSLAKFFGVPKGAVKPMSLARTFGNAGPVWREIAAKHRLSVENLSELADWPFGDFVFSAGWDDMSSIVKLRLAGFHETVATEESMLRCLGRMREMRFIP